MKKLFVLLIAASILAGCASTGDKDYLQAQLAAAKEARADQKPLVKFTAHEGKDITGLASFEVYLPSAAPQLQQARPSEWAGVVGQALGVTGTVLGIRYAGQAAIGLANTVGSSNGVIAGQIQAPGSITTNTLSGTGTLGSGAYATTDTTHAPTVVTQPAPTVVTQPAPVIVQVPAGQVVDPVIVNPVIVQP